LVPKNGLALFICFQPIKFARLELAMANHHAIDNIIIPTLRDLGAFTGEARFAICAATAGWSLHLL
jgi:hypothetical protein